MILDGERRGPAHCALQDGRKRWTRRWRSTRRKPHAENHSVPVVQ
jgi:hypothetical protein